MKNASVFFSILLFLFCFASCNKEISNASISQDLHPTQTQLSSSNYREFETFLNSTYISNPGLVDVPTVQSIGFTHVNGFISESEKQRIESLVASYLSEGNHCRVIDIDIKNCKVELISEGNGGIILPNFPNNLHPDGGLNAIGIVPSICCDNTQDPLGGGCGRVARAYFNGLIQPSNLEYWTDIRSFGLVGSCDNIIIDEFQIWDYIEIESTDFWHYTTSCLSTSGPLCLQASDMNNYLQVFLNNLQAHLPAPYQVIGNYSCTYNYFPPTQTTPANWYWYFYVKVGIPVYSGNEN